MVNLEVIAKMSREEFENHVESGVLVLDQSSYGCPSGLHPSLKDIGCYDDLIIPCEDCWMATYDVIRSRYTLLNDITLIGILNDLGHRVSKLENMLFGDDNYE